MLVAIRVEWSRLNEMNLNGNAKSHNGVKQMVVKLPRTTGNITLIEWIHQFIELHAKPF